MFIECSDALCPTSCKLPQQSGDFMARIVAKRVSRGMRETTEANDRIAGPLHGRPGCCNAKSTMRAGRRKPAVSARQR
jgi:hypothetical protein